MHDPDLKLKKIRLLAMDVDGVLTDGTLGISSDGVEEKRFHVADGMGITLMHTAKIHILWISGRKSEAVERRAGELKVTRLVQGTHDKGSVLRRAMRDLGMDGEETAFIGDDWNDLPAFEAAGVRIAVANADFMVRSHADFVTAKSGGHGAVREVCETILRSQSRTEEILEHYLAALKEKSSDGPTGQ